MPHDIKGNLIEVGDIIKAPVYPTFNPLQGKDRRRPIAVGRVLEVNPSTSCTGRILWKREYVEETPYFNASEAEIVVKKGETEKKDEASITLA